jgi:membrane protein DedA with SNARE-associated domain
VLVNGGPLGVAGWPAPSNLFVIARAIALEADGGGSASVSHAAWDARAVHGVFAVYSVNVPRCVGIERSPSTVALTLAPVDFWRGWPYPVAVAALFVVVMLRAGATYAIGRAAQEGVRRSRLARVMAKPRFARMQQLVERWGAPVVALSFLTVGIQTLVNLAAGVMRMPLRRYLPALTLGAILWAFLYATVGFATFAGWRRVYELSPAVAIASIVVLLAGLAGYIVWQVRHRHDEDEHEPANLGS